MQERDLPHSVRGYCQRVLRGCQDLWLEEGGGDSGGEGGGGEGDEDGGVGRWKSLGGKEQIGVG